MWKVGSSQQEKLYAEFAKSYSKNKYSICEIMKKGKETRTSFSGCTSNWEVIATLHGKCIIKMEKTYIYGCKIFKHYIFERQSTFT